VQKPGGLEMRLKKLIYYNYYLYLLTLWLVILPITIALGIADIIKEAINEAAACSSYYSYRKHRYFVYKK